MQRQDMWWSMMNVEIDLDSPKFQPGDQIKMVFNEQQVLLYFHPLGHKEDHHTLLIGTVGEQMPISQNEVTVKPKCGQAQDYPYAR